MQVPSFDAFVAIDWSGASAGYNGIAIAKCSAGNAAPSLIKPPGKGHWTRSDLAEWLADQLSRKEHLLVGFDFAFGFPFESNLGYLGGFARPVEGIFELWNLVDQESGDDSDFGCSTFIATERYTELFWKSGRRPVAWVERKRHTELVCAQVTQTHPDTIYKLLGSKQVGKASLTGIRVLNHIRARTRNKVAVWPFEKVRGSVFVEIYPTLFRKAATGSVAKLRTLTDLNNALEQLQSRKISRVNGLSDHETDALLSAAGMRLLANQPAVWFPEEISLGQVQREGWIFGVTSGKSGPDLLVPFSARRRLATAKTSS